MRSKKKTILSAYSNDELINELESRVYKNESIFGLSRKEKNRKNAERYVDEAMKIALVKGLDIQDKFDVSEKDMRKDLIDCILNDEYDILPDEFWATDIAYCAWQHGKEEFVPGKYLKQAKEKARRLWQYRRDKEREEYKYF